MEITIDTFNEAYNKHKPNKFTKFIFKYFSKETEKKDMKLSKSFSWFILILFFIGFISTVLKLPNIIIAVATLSYSILLSILCISMFIAWAMNNRRIRKISNELNISIIEYNKLVDKLF